MKRSKGHNRALGHEFHELAEQSYHELSHRYPKTAAAMGALGTLVPSIMDKAPALTSPFFKTRHGRGKR
jgi:hypothetical protein